MTEEEFIAKLKASQVKHAGDPEAAHGEGEEVMLELLRHLGAENFAREYEKASQHWWYA